MFYSSLGSCTSCGSLTQTGSFQLCEQCAVSKNECAFCLGRLDAEKPPATGDAKLGFFVFLNVEHYSSRQADHEHKEKGAQDTCGAIVSFKGDVLKLLAECGEPTEAVEFKQSFNRLVAVALSCTNEIAEALKVMPGVSSVIADEENQVF